MTGPSHDLLGGPAPTLLTANTAAIEATGTAAEIAAQFPAWPQAWAVLAQGALDSDETIAAYAYARTGYHRGLDALRRHGWKGFGPVPFDHEPNAGWLRCVAVLAMAAGTIGETEEQERCTQLLVDSDVRALSLLD